MRLTTASVLLAGGLAAPLALFCGGCRDVQAPSDSPAGRPAKTMVLGSADSASQREYPGKVEASQRVDLAFRVSGPLIEFPVKEGQLVAQDDLLCRIDPRDFETRLASERSVLAEAVAKEKSMRIARPEDLRTLEAQVTAARADFNKAKLQLQRTTKLVQQKVVTMEEYERDKAAYDVSVSRLNAANEDLKKGQAGARTEDLEAMRAQIEGLRARVKDAEDALEDTYLKAPFAGRLARRYVENFERVQAKQPILSLQDVEDVQIVIDIPEKDVVTASDAVRYETIARFESLPDRQFRVKLKEFSTEADPQTQTFRAVFTMRAPEDANILPGMTATVSIDRNDPREEAAAQFLIPVTAVFSDETDKRNVWLVDPGTMTVGRREIQVGDLAGGSIRVLKGLQAGDRIVTAGVHFLRQGTKIRELESAAGDSSK